MKKLKNNGRDYELENGSTLYFETLGHALEYCHKHNTRIVR
jgi:hypothetical protein